MSQQQRAQAVQRQHLMAQQQAAAAGDNEEEDEPREAEYVFLGRFKTAIVGIRYYTGRCVCLGACRCVGNWKRILCLSLHFVNGVVELVATADSSGQ